MTKINVMTKTDKLSFDSFFSKEKHLPERKRSAYNTHQTSKKKRKPDYSEERSRKRGNVE